MSEPTPAAHAALKYLDALVLAAKEEQERGFEVPEGDDFTPVEIPNESPNIETLDRLREEARKLLREECAAGNKTNRLLHTYFEIRDMAALDAAVLHLQRLFAPETVHRISHHDWLCGRAEN